jgi:hypothetical protein
MGFPGGSSPPPRPPPPAPSRRLRFEIARTGPLKAASWAELSMKSDTFALILSGESEYPQPSAQTTAPAAAAAPPPSTVSPSLPPAAAPAAATPLPVVPEDPGKCASFRGRVMGCIQQGQQYEDERLQGLALSLLDWGVTERAAAAAAADGTCERVHLAKELLTWFKSSFFSWTNSPKCSKCGGGTNGIGAVAASPDERRFLAGHTELYRCDCGTVTRFPRYNHVEKLLQTRTGRCGEWVQAFVLFCRALVRTHAPSRAMPCTPFLIVLGRVSTLVPRWTGPITCGLKYSFPRSAGGATPIPAKRLGACARVCAAAVHVLVRCG